MNLLDNVGPHFVYKYPAYPVEGSISKLVMYVSLRINLDCQYLACVPLVSSRADQRLTHQTKWRPTLRFDLTTVILQNIVFLCPTGAVPSDHAPNPDPIIHTLLFTL